MNSAIFLPEQYKFYSNGTPDCGITSIEACLPNVDVNNHIYIHNSMLTYIIPDETNYRNAIESLIQKSQIPVKAVLGKSLISVKDFSTLVPGDVIRLDTNVDDELDIYVGNIKKFTALPGSSGDKYAVRITSVVREEQ
jgi:flagellar motor switch protein FliM